MRSVESFVDQVTSWFGAALDGDWCSIAFVAEDPDNPYLIRWGWWDDTPAARAAAVARYGPTLGLL